MAQVPLEAGLGHLWGTCLRVGGLGLGAKAGERHVPWGL